MSEIQEKLGAAMAASPEESAEARAGRYERALRGITRARDLIEDDGDFSEWVQATAKALLEGAEAECPSCGTFIHEGPCVSDEEPF